jgi:hypothetical protein
MVTGVIGLYSFFVSCLGLRIGQVFEVGLSHIIGKSSILGGLVQSDM